MWVQHPQEVHLVINKGKGSLGLEVDYSMNGSSLLVLAVNPGPVLDWNEENKDKAMRKYDRIIKVNNTYGATTTELITLLRFKSNVEIVFLRYG